jgi:hypothetical protein
VNTRVLGAAFGLALLGALLVPPLVGVLLGLPWWLVVGAMIGGAASVQIAEREVTRRATPPATLLQCSFCGKSQTEVKKLIAGPAAYICDECIGLCVDILAEEGVAAAVPGPVKPAEDVWSPPDRDS